MLCSRTPTDASCQWRGPTCWRHDCGWSLRVKKDWTMVAWPGSGSSSCQRRCSTRITDCLNILPRECLFSWRIFVCFTQCQTAQDSNCLSCFAVQTNTDVVWKTVIVNWKMTLDLVLHGTANVSYITWTLMKTRTLSQNVIYNQNFISYNNIIIAHERAVIFWQEARQLIYDSVCSLISLFWDLCFVISLFWDLCFVTYPTGTTTHCRSTLTQVYVTRTTCPTSSSLAVWQAWQCITANCSMVSAAWLCATCFHLCINFIQTTIKGSKSVSERVRGIREIRTNCVV